MQIKPYKTGLLSRNKKISQLIIVDSCSSTLDLANNWMQPNSLIIAEAQTAGRGQKQRQWQSPKHSGIWASLILATTAHGLAIKAALALAYALEDLGCDPGIKIKWPNDLYLNNQKTAGILIEGISIGQTQLWAVGIGITFKDINTPNIMPLGTHWPNACKREILLDKWINEFFKLLETTDLTHLFAPYDLLKGKTIAGGIADGINNQGELIVKYSDKTITLNRSP